MTQPYFKDIRQNIWDNVQAFNYESERPNKISDLVNISDGRLENPETLEALKIKLTVNGMETYNLDSVFSKLAPRYRRNGGVIPDISFILHSLFYKSVSNDMITFKSVSDYDYMSLTEVDWTFTQNVHEFTDIVILTIQDPVTGICYSNSWTEHFPAQEKGLAGRVELVYETLKQQPFNELIKTFYKAVEGLFFMTEILHQPDGGAVFGPSAYFLREDLNKQILKRLVARVNLSEDDELSKVYLC